MDSGEGASARGHGGVMGRCRAVCVGSEVLDGPQRQHVKVPIKQKGDNTDYIFSSPR